MADKNSKLDSDDSDDDYVPDDKTGNVSEEADSGDAESDIEAETEGPTKSKRRRNNEEPEKKTNKKEEETVKIDVDAIWADFKKDADETQKRLTETKKLENTTDPGKPVATTTSAPSPHVPPQSTNLPQASSKGAGLLPASSLGSGLTRLLPASSLGGGLAGLQPAKGGGGLSGLLSKIGKKDKLSTLEKSKLDWNNFKRAEGIEEDLQTHNRGKDGFLEKRDFLERTDARQFQLEKDLRTAKRSTR